MTEAQKKEWLYREAQYCCYRCRERRMALVNKGIVQVVKTSCGCIEVMVYNRFVTYLTGLDKWEKDAVFTSICNAVEATMDEMRSSL